jgi:hypothetical protein
MEEGVLSWQPVKSSVIEAQNRNANKAHLFRKVDEKREEFIG